MPEKMLQELLAPPRPHRVSMQLPMVTFIMPTFGRAARQPDVINEAVYWVTATTYPNWELVILNDATEQRLHTKTPGVRIVNWPYRLKSLGEKMNLGVTLAAGSVCMPAEDDDISLPWRAKKSVEGVAEYDYWNPGYYWYEERGKPLVADSKGVGHNCSVFRRYSLLNRYPPISRGHDSKVQDYAKEYTKVNPKVITADRLSEIFYVYRWGVSDFHLSGQRDMEAAYAAADPGPPGEYEIVPKMGKDYIALHAQAVLGYGQEDGR